MEKKEDKTCSCSIIVALTQQTSQGASEGKARPMPKVSTCVLRVRQWRRFGVR